MANLTPDENYSLFQIRTYSPGMIKINDQIYTKSLIIAPDQLISDWSPQSIQELSSETLAVAVSLNPDILLIGTGSTLIFPSLELYGNLFNQGIGVEIMASDAACRTYHVLTS